MTKRWLYCIGLLLTVMVLNAGAAKAQTAAPPFNHDRSGPAGFSLTKRGVGALLFDLIDGFLPAESWHRFGCSVF